MKWIRQRSAYNWTVGSLFVFAGLDLFTGDEMHAYIYLGAILGVLHIETLRDIVDELRHRREATDNGQ